MTGETFFQLHYHLTDTERLFDLAQGIAARRRRLKKHDARCRRFSWYARGLLRRGIAFLILAAVLGAMTVLLKLGGVSGAMAGLCFGCGVTELVLGYPKNMDGTLGPRAEKAAAFGETLKELTGLPLTLWDERRTTIDAHNILFQNGQNAKKRKKTVDAVAAALMLEGYLTRRRLEAQR